jgi:hypothetical protein
MSKKFETPDWSKTESGKEAVKTNNIPDMTPKPETVTGMEKKMEKQREIKKKENTEIFCSRMDGFEKDYANYKVEVGENTYTLKLDHLQVDGKKVEKNEYGDVKEKINDGKIDLDSVGGAFTLDGGGVTLQYSLSASLMVGPEGAIKERLVNDFSGGADKWKKEVEAPAPEARPEKPKTESAAEKDNKERQVEETKKMAQLMGGETSIMSGEGLTSMFITFPRGRQLKISSTTGAVWNGEQIENGRRTSLGAKATPLEFLVPGEKDPGA